jgi:hypothetical protein
MNSKTRATKLEIEVMPDLQGAEMLRQLADAIEANPDDGSPRGATGIVELPVGMPDRLDAEALTNLADAIHETGALEGEPGLDLATVWVVFDAFLFVGVGSHPTDLIDALLDVGSSMSKADSETLCHRVNRWLRRTGHGYQIVPDGEGGFYRLEVAPKPAFKMRRMSFKPSPS